MSVNDFCQKAERTQSEAEFERLADRERDQSVMMFSREPILVKTLLAIR